MYGAKAMLGKLNDLVARCKKTHMRHYCLLQHGFAVKKLTEELKDVHNNCFKIINFLNVLCECMGSLHETILLSKDV